MWHIATATYPIALTVALKFMAAARVVIVVAAVVVIITC